MNILIPHSWLLEHLDTDASPKEIQRLLSLSGPSIERIYQKDGEAVYDIEVTTNRVDSMSVRGIAREAAVILKQAGRKTELQPLSNPQFESNNQLPIPKIENNPVFCKRIICIVLSNIQHNPTPALMAKRLTQIDQNVHDAAIDITNYVTHELGHPCHAFDYDKIMKLGGVIKVKEAAAGKKFITLDKEEYQTVGGEIVFENDQGEIIDFPAIKGTANTAVDNSTNNILFWIESLSAEKVRFGSMSHAIRTVAAQLNEKNVDPYLAEPVLRRAVELYQQFCNAKVASEIYDDFPTPPQMQPVAVTKQKVSTYLGIELENQIITNILKSLGCTVDWKNDSTFQVTPPTFRPDLTIPADIIEELARIYGYHHLPSALMATAIPLTKPENSFFNTEARIKQFLANLGWQEVYTYSMVSEQIALESGCPIDQHLKLQNPLTEDRVYLRRSVLPSLNEVLDNNPEHLDLSVFEIANVYHPQSNELPDEVLMLTLLSPQSYRQSRGVLETLLKQFFITDLIVTPTSETEAAIQIIQNAEQIEIGKVVRLDFRIGFAIEMRKLQPLLKNHPRYQPLAKSAPIKEDLTFQFPSQTTIGIVTSAIKSASNLVKTVELKEIYEQNFTFTMTYNHQTQSLSSAEVEPIRKAIVQILTERFQGKLIGSLQ
ncbi:MAG: hypothetical protein COY81_03895 [Candidatus Pacebacteria bacterium CG_4_10_14_0_8_um_filter_43_12]|nr:MAG: hypothetical protein COY81_03895 [Candidatus Pacebacteria bacterium CG_4_10_14_0_8_um_filter_43_12]